MAARVLPEGMGIGFRGRNLDLVLILPHTVYGTSLVSLNFISLILITELLTMSHTGPNETLRKRMLFKMYNAK